MTRWLFHSIRAIALAVPALLGACGGGRDEDRAAPAVDVPGRARALAAQAHPAPASTAGGDLQIFIVQVVGDPVVAYRGGLAGLPATRPAPGRKIDPGSPQVSRYLDHLRARHDSLLGAAGGGRKLYSYGYVFNGFAATLTPDQVDRLRRSPAVMSVSRAERRRLNTASTPAFLGLDAAGGLWQQVGGAVAGNGPSSGGAGEGIVVGLIDSGIWPEHPSFSDRDAQGKRVYQQLPGWHGRCVPGDDFTATHCNQKLIGARFYNAGQGGNAVIDADSPEEFNSPRDYDGHGTHTASIAAGNHGVRPEGAFSVFGTISGMAPRARIAAYKACWHYQGVSYCHDADTVAAIDQAVADGVDVINYSIAGSETNFRDPVEIAFLFAADAGVFVAAAAGNNGPTPSSVAHPSPWITTVAAGTHSRTGAGSVTLGNGVRHAGSSLNFSPQAGPLADAVNLGAAAAAPAEVELCYPNSLDPARVQGRIVLCKRGVVSMLDKSAEVRRAGGVGVVIYNNPLGFVETQSLSHELPTVHVAAAAGLAIKAYIAALGASATATIDAAQVVYDRPAPFIADYSSRGPLLAGGGDLLKPDLVAPGSEVLAGVAPPGNGGVLFQSLIGTSMAAPHVAGLAALLKHRHPGWSPMAIKSALMTSAYDILDGPGTDPGVIFSQGAGHVRPNGAANPGLVYDSGFAEWLGFLCGTQLPVSFCSDAGVPVLDPSNLNLASVAIGDLAGTQTVMRRVTNVSGQLLSLTASVEGVAGFDVVVSPANLTVAPGASAIFTIRFTATAATVPGEYRGGRLTWSGGGYEVRSPIIVRPTALAAPAQVSGSYGIVFGYDGPFSASARGLVPASLYAGTVAQDPDQRFDPLDPTGTLAFTFTIPAGTTYARFELYDADVAPGTDLDLFVLDSSGALVAYSAGATAAEAASLRDPAPGDYKVFVHGWGVPGGSSPVRLHAWLLGSQALGNMTVSAPASATIGGVGTVNLSFSGLASGVRYLGAVAYAGSPGLPEPTIVQIGGP